MTVDQPISTDEGDLRKALYGSFLPIPADDAFPPCDEAEFREEKQPGAVIAAAGDIEMNKGRSRRRVRVTNKGDRAVQVSVRVERRGAWLTLWSVIGRLPLSLHRD